MNNIRNKINDNIMAPLLSDRTTSYVVAEVTKSNESENNCSIKYINKDGYLSNKDSVRVRIFNVGIIDWFPSVGDYVNVEQIEDDISIISKFEGNYATSTKPGTQNKNDILSSTFCDTMSGSIF